MREIVGEEGVKGLIVIAIFAACRDAECEGRPDRRTYFEVPAAQPSA